MRYLFVHVEEPSMQETMEAVLPRLIKQPHVELKVIDHGSKQALLKNLPNQLQGYANWPEPGLRVLVLVDRDDEDCILLKHRLEQAALSAGLHTKAAPDTDDRFKVVNRIVVEELEAWFLGDIPALVAAYPGVPPSLGSKARFRDPDAVTGGTWEALFQVLNKAGYYAGSDRLPKIEVARRIAPFLVADNNKSCSFRAFQMGLDALLAT